MTDREATEDDCRRQHQRPHDDEVAPRFDDVEEGEQHRYQYRKKEYVKADPYVYEEAPVRLFHSKLVVSSVGSDSF